MKVVGTLVAGLTDLKSVMPMLSRLGRSHSALGVKAAAFEALREALLESLADHLGPIRWTKEASPPPSSHPPLSPLCARDSMHREENVGRL